MPVDDGQSIDAAETFGVDLGRQREDGIVAVEDLRRGMVAGHLGHGFPLEIGDGEFGFDHVLKAPFGIYIEVRGDPDTERRHSEKHTISG